MSEDATRGFRTPNATCIAVYQCSWLPRDQWQYSVSGPWGMTFGGADSEEAAWAKARGIARMEQQLRDAPGAG